MQGYKSEGEGEGGFSFHILSFSTLLPFDICTVFVFDIFTFDQSRGNHRCELKSISSIFLLFDIFTFRHFYLSTFLPFDISTFRYFYSSTIFNSTFLHSTFVYFYFDIFTFRYFYLSTFFLFDQSWDYLLVF
jgi:hypothetical protein